MKKHKDTKEVFLEKYYTACPKCSYNNEKGRLNQYGTCLKCGAVLDEKIYFKIQMLKRIKDNKRRQG